MGEHREKRGRTKQSSLGVLPLFLTRKGHRRLSPFFGPVTSVFNFLDRCGRPVHFFWTQQWQQELSTFWTRRTVRFFGHSLCCPWYANVDVLTTSSASLDGSEGHGGQGGQFSHACPLFSHCLPTACPLPAHCLPTVSRTTGMARGPVLTFSMGGVQSQARDRVQHLKGQ